MNPVSRHSISYHQPMASKGLISKLAHMVQATLPTEKEKIYSDRFYDQYVPFHKIVELGLDNRRREAHVPLMNLMKAEMGLDVEKETLGDLHGVVKNLYPEKNDEQVEAIIKNKGSHPKDVLKTVIRDKIVRDKRSYDALVSRYRSLSFKRSVSKEEGVRCAFDAGTLLPIDVQHKVLSKFLGKNVSKLSERQLKSEFDKIKSSRRWLILAKKFLESFDLEPSSGLKRSFNTVDDAYGKLVLDSYLAKPGNRDKVSQTIQDWTNRKTARKILDELLKVHNFFKFSELDRMEEKLVQCFQKKDTPEFVTALKSLVKDRMISAPDVQQTFTDILMTQFKREIVKKIFTRENLADPEFLAEVKSRLNNLQMETLKEAQCHQINQYDGLIEHFSPATVRGLHDVDDKVVKQLAIEGDYASIYDIFNHEVSSGARNSLYSRGHTGSSNRSTSLNFNIASYFATSHGMSSGTPKNVWFMIYEPQEALYMSDIEAAGDWKEAEIVMPHLGAKRFLGAVKFEVDQGKTNSKKISLKPVDGFLSDKAKKGEFDATGIVGKVKRLYDYAKAYSDHSTEGLKNMTIARRPRALKSWMSTAQKIAQYKKISAFKQKISEYPNQFVASVLPKKEMPSDHAAYLAERAKQKAFVDLETDLQRAARLEKERLSAAFLGHQHA